LVSLCRARGQGSLARRALPRHALAEHEIAERHRRRLARHLAEAQLLPGKTLDSFDFDVVPMISKAHVLAICAGDSWIGQGANLLLIGGPGGGKTHLASAIGLALVENGWRVLFARTSDLVQRLQVARRELALEAAINRLGCQSALFLAKRETSRPITMPARPTPTSVTSR
jgi:DNA replication protein DnaC